MLLGVNVKYSSDIVDELDKRVASMESILKDGDASLKNVNLGSEDRLVVDNDNTQNFEEQFRENFDDVFKDNPSPCAFGDSPDGKGGCLCQDKAFDHTIGN